MRISGTAIMVDDQQHALEFYTETLGFMKHQDVPVGEYRWISLKSPEDDAVELSLEPNANPAGKTYQEALFEQGIPFTAFEVNDIDAEFSRLSYAGVTFTKPPTEAGPVKLAILADTCGNLIQIYQRMAK